MRLPPRFPLKLSSVSWLLLLQSLSLSSLCGGAFARLLVWLWVPPGLVLLSPDVAEGEGFGPPLIFLKGGLFMPIADVVTCYVNVVQVALPVALVFGLGDLCVGTILRAAFGGRLSFRA